MLEHLFSPDFMPHGYCYRWDPWIVWLHVVSDGLIVLAYYCIPVALVYLVRKRQDLPFNWIFWMFGLFILGCGTTHLMEIWTVWHATYLLAGVLKALTAAVSVATAVMLIPLLPKALAIPSFGQLHAVNQALEVQISERTRAERELRETLELRELALAELADQKSAVADLRIAQETLRDSEDRFRGVIESAMDGIITIDANQKILMFNSTAEAMFLCPAQEALGTSVERFLPSRFRAAHAGHIRRFAETGVTSRGMGAMNSLWAQRADGTEFPIEASISQVASGEEKLFSVILRDVTERKRIENALQKSLVASEHALKELADQKFALDQHAIVAITDVQGTITYVNDKFCSISQYSREELIGSNHRILNSGHHSREFFQQMYRTIAAGKVWHDEIRNRAKDGSFYWVDTTIVPALNAEGKPQRYVAIRADITQRKLAEAELVIQKTELARSNSDLEQFAYAASHDLQEPLRAVAGCVHLLQARYADKLDGRAHEYMQHAVEGATRMQNLIDDLLSFSRVGTRGKEFQAVECEKAVENALKNLTVAIQEKHARIEHDPLPVVSGDLTQLSLLFQNLIGNALKFCGSATPFVRLRAEHKQSAWEISVRDNGIGIDRQYFERIFVIFQRLHTRKEYPGTGMGLALCKKIVERHGGQIWVESEMGEGTTFRFTLPASRVQQARLR